MDEPSTLETLMGALHPAAVHFPIALIIMAAVVEIWNGARRRPAASGTSLFLASMGLVAAGVAIWFGWVQAGVDRMSDPFGEGPAAGPVFFHRWISILAGVFVVAGVAAAVIGRTTKSTGAGNLYRGAMVVAAVLVMVSGYFGAEMTHGRGHLLAIVFPPDDATTTPVVAVADPAPVTAVTTDVVTEDVPPDTDPAPVEPAVKMVSFFKEVRPIFMENCVECHNANRKKGGLQIEPINLVLARPANRALIVVGNGEGSELVRRMRLPADDHDLMPMGGDPLPAEQVDLIVKWIDEGAIIDEPADPGAIAAEEPDDEEGTEVVAVATPTVVPLPPLEPPSQELLDRLAERRVVALPVSVGSNLLNVNMSVARPPVGDDDLALLAGLEANILWLDLSRSGVTDAGLASLEGMVRLERLRLDGTAVTDRGLAQVPELRSLRSLNLFGTGVTDAGMIPLTRLDGLTKLYVAGTGVTDAGAANLGVLLPQLEVVGAAELLSAAPAEPAEQKPAEEPEG